MQIRSRGGVKNELSEIPSVPGVPIKSGYTRIQSGTALSQWLEKKMKCLGTNAARRIKNGKFIDSVNSISRTGISKNPSR